MQKRLGCFDSDVMGEGGAGAVPGFFPIVYILICGAMFFVHVAACDCEKVKGHVSDSLILILRKMTIIQDVLDLPSCHYGNPCYRELSLW